MRPITLLSISFFSLFISSKLLAQEIITTMDIDWFDLVVGLTGGISIFLYGMDKMSTGLKQVAGSSLRRVLTMLTQNRVVGMFVGLFITMIIQSSTASTVMLVSFVQAGLLQFSQTLGVLLGTGIGTTVTAQLIAFKLTDYALFVVSVGFLLKVFIKSDRVKNISTAILGFGLLFFGMRIMIDSMGPVRTYTPFIETMKNLENPLVGILFGMMFTALIHSSGAFLGLVVVLAQQDIITVTAGIPLMIGTNIGTCITAVMASIGTKREAVRVAIAHVGFKVVGALLVVWWIPGFTKLVHSLNYFYDFSNARQIANAHTVYNVGLTLFFLPFTKYVERLINWAYPEKKTISSDLSQTLTPIIKHLDYGVVNNPEMSIGLARSEIHNMIKLVEKMVEFVIAPFLNSTPQFDKKYPTLSVVEGIHVRENKVDFIEENVRKYLLKVSQQELSDRQIAEVFGLISIMSDLEAIGDIVEKNMLPLIVKKESLGREFSSEGKEELKLFHLKVCKQISRIKFAFHDHDLSKAQRGVQKMERYMDLEEEFRMKHMIRLRQARPETIETHEIHMDIMDKLKQINVYTGEIAKIIYQMTAVETGEKIQG
ncbi:MAG: hypothetical protein A2504_12560 [Bdellovibrionales bacterium RIFOXYD12_FULL_39_22]|nr:MAG: hypothetical protein A2385_00100 [Bdellovibrionales bacterium RIFOXYB1_FULL_39_21]OFZ44057.1 MAG: hypothetical protein A2485_03765 [Bdellovibrionales bacterium RIFOXYC12_FULL_39_17]OFZ48541.1 MAG: hypothetical protein A2404_07305 [Bdellovibrionales bacterium RIFOXYC1_FULL_39_130]OFZ76729.1 MAG: hypothetical protein A2560_11680 [Bdellovibrionales bacterium RIFOXYD1_FULL_39_84]OFZ95007.1 MAG: hypothetical protein A2504_12560 [Bdellovibrionales bacterium RIFOXYD12_FULL_39_22]HLE11184.1 Na